MTLLRFVKLDKSEIDKACAAYVNQIIQHSQPLAIYLFGSMAEGHASIESDIDILTVYASVEAAKAAQREVWRQKSPYPIAADLIFIDEASWKQNKSPLLSTVRSEGKLLYQSPDFKDIG